MTCKKLQKSCDPSNLYLSGEEMFLIKNFDGSSKLSPTLDRGWNFYHECGKEDKGQVAESGLRTDWAVLLDREHPESLLKDIPLSNLCPQRTGTGWIIDPSRLLEVLTFKYPYIADQLYVRLWGDGREIGGRQYFFSNVPSEQ